MDDERAIRRLIVLYGQLLDDGRYDEWAGLFAQDASFGGSVSDQAHVGREAIREYIVGMQAPMKGKHIACASLIEVDGDTALAWTDFIALVDVGEGNWGRQMGIATGARYYDRLVRQGDRWLFAVRQVRMPDKPLPPGAVEVPAR